MAFRYRKFQVYQDAKALHKEVVSIVNKFPHSYLYLVDQICRSSLSIILNIAEGSSKQSDKDFNRYITISLGSVDETVASLEMALEFNLITIDQFTNLEDRHKNVSLQLGGLSKYLKKS